MIVKLNDIMGKIEDLIHNPFKKTYSLGIPPLEPHYKVVLGRTTYIGGIPSHGKSEWLFEMLIRLSEEHGFKHLIYTPETGEAHEVYTELICKYTKTLLRPNAINKLTVDIARHAAAFIHTHFIVREMDENAPSPAEFIKEVEAEMLLTEINTISIDPWNEMSHDFSHYAGREDKYLESVLGSVRRFARRKNIHAFIVVHPRTLQQNKDGVYEAPTAFHFSGGGVWFAKGDSILCAHRPYEHSESEWERTFCDIIIQKAKPKIVGSKGTLHCDYNLQTGRYGPRPGEAWYPIPTQA